MDGARFDRLALAVAAAGTRRRLLGGLLGIVLADRHSQAVVAQELPTPCAPDRLTQDEAERLLGDGGIGWSSSGNCSDRTNTRCTSFEDIRRSTVDGIVGFREASGCDVVVTGGTENGHSRFIRLPHWDGYKVDVRPTDCIDAYIAETFEEIAPRRNGDRQWRSPAGDTYTREGDHWDITFEPGLGAGETRCGDGCCGACLACNDAACVPVDCGDPCLECRDGACVPVDCGDPCLRCAAGACVERCAAPSACVDGRCIDEQRCPGGGEVCSAFVYGCCHPDEFCCPDGDYCCRVGCVCCGLICCCDGLQCSGEIGHCQGA